MVETQEKLIPGQYYEEKYIKKPVYIDPNVLRFLAPEEQADLRLMMDPSAWAEDRLGWKPREYQEEFFTVLPDSKQIVLRWGRRLGKSDSMIVG